MTGIIMTLLKWKVCPFDDTCMYTFNVVASDALRYVLLKSMPIIATYFVEYGQLPLD